MKPIIIPANQSEAVQKLINTNHPHIHDHYQDFVQELFKIRHPQSPAFTESDIIQLRTEIGDGNWVYFPWSNTCAHLLPAEELFELKTSRNKFLITKEEQEILRNTTVLVCGMSTGSHAALTWMMQAHANAIKIADFDTLDGSNLNRIRRGWPDTYQPKTSLVEQELYNQNPYTKVITYSGINDNNLEEAFDNSPQTTVIVDLCDGLEAKIALRKAAKQRHLPVVMTTDIDTALKVEVERYDLNPNLNIFNNQVPELENVNLSSLTPHQKRSLIIRLVGFDQNSLAMLNSLQSLGKSITTWPQLASAAVIGGGVITTLITKIRQGKQISSGIYWINLESLFEANYPELRLQQEQLINQIVSPHLTRQAS